MNPEKDIEAFLEKWEKITQNWSEAQKREVLERWKREMVYPNMAPKGRKGDWAFLVELGLDTLFKWKHRTTWISWVHRFVTVLLVVFVVLIIPDLNPPILVRLGIAADVASELIMSEQDAIAAGIPGAQSGNIQIPDDIESPEYFGRIYPQGTAFVKTQGPHGASYGHAAIDYSAGNGTAVLSPINGVVTAKYVDGFGNPTLKIENQNFAVTMLHMSKIHMQLGDRVEAGQHIADEGNLGYSLCSDGQKPNGRDCGYHIHIDVDHQVLGQLDAADYLDRYLGGQ